MSSPLLHIVQADEAGQRLRDLARQVFPQLLSAQGARKAIRQGQVKLDGSQVASDSRLVAGQTIHYLQPEIVVLQTSGPPIPVLYEDDWLAVVDKPAGIEVSGKGTASLAVHLRAVLAPSTRPDALLRPWPVHRLDHGTRGALLVAKCYQTQLALGAAFAQRQIHKTYEALVRGVPPPQGILQAALDGQTAETHFERLHTSPSVGQGHISHLRLSPQTGRTHQLRRHLSGAGWPILGDQRYSPAGEVLRGRGLFLASVGLRFQHPAEAREVLVQLSSPRKFLRFWEREEARWERAQFRKESEAS